MPDLLETAPETWFDCKHCDVPHIMDDNCNHGYCIDCASESKCAECQRIWAERTAGRFDHYNELFTRLFGDQ